MIAVYDRTQEDIDNRTDKGFLSAADMNRIEQNLATLAAALGVEHEAQAWDNAGKPTASDMSRILDKIAEMKAAYAAYPSTPALPSLLDYRFEKFNSVEQNIFDIHALYEDNAAARSFAGEVYAGNMIGVI